MATAFNFSVEEKAVQQKTKRNLFYIGIVSIIILFGGFKRGYICAKEKGEWLYFEIPFIFWNLSSSILFIIITNF